MALPESCTLTDTHLVFSELATAEQLADEDSIYEHCCFIACTNALRPLGPVEAAQAAIPELDLGTSMMWGNRVLSAAAAEEYRAQGLLLCELRLRVEPMAGASLGLGARPPSTDNAASLSPRGTSMSVSKD
jgi:hypothetical protein